MQARVDPDVRESMHRMADACGASASLVIELMIAQQAVDDRGRPVWWEAALAANDSTPQNEGQLPMSA